MKSNHVLKFRNYFCLSVTNVYPMLNLLQNNTCTCLKMVNLPKWRNTYCPHPKCRAHKKFKVTQYKKSAESKQAQGRRR